MGEERGEGESADPMRRGVQSFREHQALCLGHPSRPGTAASIATPCPFLLTTGGADQGGTRQRVQGCHAVVGRKTGTLQHRTSGDRFRQEVANHSLDVSRLQGTNRGKGAFDQWNPILTVVGLGTLLMLRSGL